MTVSSKAMLNILVIAPLSRSPKMVMAFARMRSRPFATLLMPSLVRRKPTSTTASSTFCACKHPLCELHPQMRQKAVLTHSLTVPARTRHTRAPVRPFLPVLTASRIASSVPPTRSAPATRASRKMSAPEDGMPGKGSPRCGFSDGWAFFGSLLACFRVFCCMCGH